MNARFQLFQINIGTVNRQESTVTYSSTRIGTDKFRRCQCMESIKYRIALRVIANCCQIRALCTFSQVSMKCVPLASGGEIPVVGLGTWQATAQEVEDAVTTALDSGYRHIDTAFNYNNEEAIGNALTKWFSTRKSKREDIFITSKLPHIGNRAQDVSRFLKMSLERLKLNYVDLYLIHMPFGFICDESTLTPAILSNGEYEMDLLTDHLATWKAMEEQVKAGLVKHIGLSNFNSQQIRKVYDNATVKPSVLQVELHAYMQQKQLRALCKELNIIVTAYSPLGSPAAKSHFQNKYNFTLNEFPNILGHPVVLELVNKYNKSPAQILLKHLVQHNIVVIPKSANATRIADNLNIFDFELTEADIGKLDTIDRGEQGRIFNFLFYKGIDKHPEYPFAKLNDSC